MEIGVARCFKKRRDMLELAANNGVWILCCAGKQGLASISSLPVKDANDSFRGLLIQLIANTKEFHDRS
jgi:hypothetical protein